MKNQTHQTQEQQSRAAAHQELTDGELALGFYPPTLQLVAAGPPVIQRDAEDSARRMTNALHNIIAGGMESTVSVDSPEHPQFYADSIQNEGNHAFFNTLWDLYKALHWTDAYGHSPQYWAALGLERLGSSLEFIGEVDHRCYDISIYRRRVYDMLGLGGEQLESVRFADADQSRYDAVVNLTTYYREHFPDRALLDQYLDNPAVTAEEKARTLGQLANQVARMEFLLGWMYHGGVGNGDWETTSYQSYTTSAGQQRRRFGANPALPFNSENYRTTSRPQDADPLSGNEGPFTSFYHEQMGTHTLGAAWCTKFVGYSYSRLGNNLRESSGSNAIFWSGSRLHRWTIGRFGNQNLAEEMTLPTAGEAIEARDAGETGVFIGENQWGGLTDRITAAAESDRINVVNTFFSETTTPRPGDILLIDSETNNRIRGSSHTTMVDRYDATSATIYTIDGNSGGAVRSRAINLTNLADTSNALRNVGLLIRFGTSNFGSTTPAPAHEQEGEAATPAMDNGVHSAQMIRHLVDANAALLEIAHSRGWVNSDDVNASVFEWHNGPQGTGGEDLSTE